MLPPRFRRIPSVNYRLQRQASIKDIVESLRIPHTEVGRLLVGGRDVSFSSLVGKQDIIDVFPHGRFFDVFHPTSLRPAALVDLKFLVDINVGKLASLLRMLGFDTKYQPLLDDPELASIASRERRILLSRDRNLLKRKIVEFGHLVREIKPLNQAIEIVELFALRDKIRPFSRCLRCNGRLREVAKDKISSLEPLTRKYYNDFKRCTVCGQIYWPGSHRQKMERVLAEIIGERNE